MVRQASSVSGTGVETVLIDAKAKVHPWIRLNRVVRDIPRTISAGVARRTSGRDSGGDASAGKVCRCIRCREVGDISGFQQIKDDKEFKTKSEGLGHAQMSRARKKGGERRPEV